MDHFDQAIVRLHEAERLLKIYPKLEEPKLLKPVLTRLFESIHLALTPMVDKQYEFPDEFQDIILAGTQQLNHMQQEYVEFLHELKEFHADKEQAPVEFLYNKQLVFASQDYDLSIYSRRKVELLVMKAKFFMQEMIEVVEENDERKRKTSR